MNSALEEIPRSSFTFDFAYEQQLIRRLQSASQSSTSEVSKQNAGMLTLPNSSPCKAGLEVCVG